jgi:branched-subunit amino acid aminotransferase/4-amino-4-deoxychorismate lyase
MLNNSSGVLDTLRFKDGKIFLKKFHVERTYEALNFKKINISLENVIHFYDLIEEESAMRIQPQQILRISIPLVSSEGQTFDYSFDPIKDLSQGSQVELKDLPYFPLNPKLQVLSSFPQQSGLGKQNFKWTDRQTWQSLLAQKNSFADDVIAINEKHEITETSRCNIFCFDPKSDCVFTPRLDSGCVNGVYRRFVMSKCSIDLPGHGIKKVIEKNIDISDIQNYSIFLTNSIREVLPASVLVD